MGSRLCFYFAFKDAWILIHVLKKLLELECDHCIPEYNISLGLARDSGLVTSLEIGTETSRDPSSSGKLTVQSSSLGKSRQGKRFP